MNYPKLQEFLRSHTLAEKHCKLLSVRELLALCALHLNGIMIAGELGDVIGTVPAQTTRVLNRLKKYSFVVLSFNGDDRRRTDIRITSAGVQIVRDFIRILGDE